MSAWTAWKAATRLLFWSVCKSVFDLFLTKEKINRELAVFAPKKPQDMFDGGFVLFVYDIVTDSWMGYWRSSDAHEHSAVAADYVCNMHWEKVPWHNVEIANYYRFETIRAVPKKFADRYMKLGVQFQAAAA